MFLFIFWNLGIISITSPISIDGDHRYPVCCWWWVLNSKSFLLILATRYRNQIEIKINIHIAARCCCCYCDSSVVASWSSSFCWCFLHTSHNPATPPLSTRDHLHLNSSILGTVSGALCPGTTELQAAGHLTSPPMKQTDLSVKNKQREITWRLWDVSQTTNIQRGINHAEKPLKIKI